MAGGAITVSWRGDTQFRAFIVLAAAIWLATAGPAAAQLSAKDAEGARAAIAASDDRKFAQASALTAHIRDPLTRRLVSWYRLTRSGARPSFREITRFVNENPDWPRLGRLRRLAERALTSATPDRAVIAWFDRHPPLTATGGKRFIEALLRAGESGDATDEIRRIWRRGIFRGDERAFHRTYAKHLRPEDHAARLDYLLWRGRRGAAERLLAIVKFDRGVRAVTQARLAMMAWRSSSAAAVDQALKAVPKAHKDDPGLLYDRIRWNRRKKRDEEARRLLGRVPLDLAHAKKWSLERTVQVRNSLKAGDYEEAYEVARGHRQREGGTFLDAEWIAGWLALRFVHRPEAALRHFTRVYMGANYPISVSRGAYWSGRAAEALKQKSLARDWYESAARHSTALYGQLAARRLGRRKLSLPAEPVVGLPEAKVFDNKDLVRAVRLLDKLGETRLARPLLMHIFRTARTPGERMLASGLALEINRLDVAVRMAKYASYQGQVLITPSYPVIQVPDGNGIEPSLLLALIRQESEFQFSAVSRAGALGLMQLMPFTAAHEARDLGLPYSRARLTSDPQYNMSLGAAHLVRLLDRFDGEYVLVFAAYNAGAHRVDQWISTYGDPRSSAIDVVDWIESIPYQETRNYVQRILESLHIYRAQLGSSRAEVANVFEGWRQVRSTSTAANDGACAKGAPAAQKPVAC
ncbi:MAG: lytic transglycosylase domain-containing protein [Alphaproteobacteria bacterium]